MLLLFSKLYQSHRVRSPGVSPIFLQLRITHGIIFVFEPRHRHQEASLWLESPVSLLSHVTGKAMPIWGNKSRFCYILVTVKVMSPGQMVQKKGLYLSVAFAHTVYLHHVLQHVSKSCSHVERELSFCQRNDVRTYRQILKPVEVLSMGDWKYQNSYSGTMAGSLCPVGQKTSKRQALETLLSSRNTGRREKKLHQVSFSFSSQHFQTVMIPFPCVIGSLYCWEEVWSTPQTLVYRNNMPRGSMDLQTSNRSSWEAKAGQLTQVHDQGPAQAVFQVSQGYIARPLVKKERVGGVILLLIWKFG